MSLWPELLYFRYLHFRALRLGEQRELWGLLGLLGPPLIIWSGHLLLDRRDFAGLTLTIGTVLFLVATAFLSRSGMATQRNDRL